MIMPLLTSSSGITVADNCCCLQGCLYRVFFFLRLECPPQISFHCFQTYSINFYLLPKHLEKGVAVFFLRRPVVQFKCSFLCPLPQLYFPSSAPFDVYFFRRSVQKNVPNHSSSQMGRRTLPCPVVLWPSPLLQIFWSPDSLDPVYWLLTCLPPPQISHPVASWPLWVAVLIVFSFRASLLFADP